MTVTTAFARLAEMSEVEDGWLAPGSPSPNDAAVGLASAVVDTGRAQGVPLPLVFPLAEGGIQLEWRSEAGEVEIEIGNDGSVTASVLNGVHVGDDDVVHQPLTAAAEPVIEFVARYSPVELEN